MAIYSCRSILLVLPVLLFAVVSTVHAADATVRVKYENTAVEFDTLKEGCKFFTNCSYALREIPKAAVGLKFSRIHDEVSRSVEIDAPADAVVFVIVGSDHQDQDGARRCNRCPELTKKLATDGWEDLGDARYVSPDGNNFVTVFKRRFTSAQSFTLSGAGWGGIEVAAKSIGLKSEKSSDQPDEPATAKKLSQNSEFSR